MNLWDISQEICKNGPSRVIINSEGEATTPRQARENYQIVPDIIFIRKDGWSLGARKEHARIAAEMWKDEWLYFLIRPLYEICMFTDIGTMIYNLNLKLIGGSYQ